MTKRILYAQHNDGRRLYLPQWTDDGEVIASRLLTAAVTIDQDGVTFPVGSTWIWTDSFRGTLQHGWNIVGDTKARVVSQNRPKVPPAKPSSTTTDRWPLDFATKTLGVTLADLKGWDPAALVNLAFRVRWPKVQQESAERFAEYILDHVRKATTAEQLIADAWRYALQLIENTSAEKPESGENALRQTKKHGVGVKVIRSSKDRVKRFRAKKRGWTPQPLTPYQAVKAHQMSGSKLCFICGRPNTGPHHIIPREEGGLPLADNIVWLCKPHHDEIEGPFTGADCAREKLYFARQSYDPSSDLARQIELANGEFEQPYATASTSESIFPGVALHE